MCVYNFAGFMTTIMTGRRANSIHISHRNHFSPAQPNRHPPLPIPSTVCNRTYYGDIGRTYSLRVPPPQWNRLPFLCHITFTASGREQGDIVQVSVCVQTPGPEPQRIVLHKQPRGSNKYWCVYVCVCGLAYVVQTKANVSLSCWLQYVCVCKIT